MASQALSSYASVSVGASPETRVYTSVAADGRFGKRGISVSPIIKRKADYCPFKYTQHVLADTTRENFSWIRSLTIV